MGGNLDAWIASVRNCELIPERDLKHLCEYVQEIMLEESTVQPVSSPVTICGDIHGQVRCAGWPRCLPESQAPQGSLRLALGC